MDRIFPFVLGFCPALLLGGLMAATLAANRAGAPSTALGVAAIATLLFILPIPGLTAVNTYGSATAVVGAAAAFVAGYSFPKEYRLLTTFVIGVAFLVVLALVVDAGRRDGLTILYVPALLAVAWVILPILATSGGKPMKAIAVATAVLPIMRALGAGRP